jgi:hypothetical protein
MTSADEVVSRACASVPGLVRCALVFLPEEVLIAGSGAESVLDYEPLIRSACSCLATPSYLSGGDGVSSAFVEYVFAVEDQYIVIQGGRGDSRLGLAVVCTNETNVAFVIGSTRLAIRAIEGTIDLAAWEAGT